MNAWASGLAVAALAVALSASVGADETPAEPPSRAERDRGNICFGGFEHGKLIPADDQINDPFTQTTLFGCAVEGGVPTFLPDLKPKVSGGLMG